MNFDLGLYSGLLPLIDPNLGHQSRVRRLWNLAPLHHWYFCCQLKRWIVFGSHSLFIARPPVSLIGLPFFPFDFGLL